LNKSLKDGTLPTDDADSIEIATNCIAESFKVDPTDSAAIKDAVGDKSLLDIYNVYEKLKGRAAPATTAGAPSAGTAKAAPAASGVDADTKTKAEALKSQGNSAIQKKDYDSAIDFYTQALDLVPLNPIYLSNRAAAYSGAARHEDAVNDAEMAVAADPKFSKAWSRLGFAKYALGDASGAMEAYQKGIEAEGNGGSDAMRRGFETAKKKVAEEGGDVNSVADRGIPGAGAGGMPDLSSLAGMFGGGGAGGAGGMPDFGAMMQNPMMKQMANNFMQNPEMLGSMLNNPALQGMFNGAGRGGGAGGGMPDMASLMQDPSIMEM
jgi:small glutamine-rich tetratricopeptide repeat-containing protein alpha